MFFTKLLNKIPFFRNRKIKKLKRDLAEIKVDFADGFFNDKYIISLHNILESSQIDFSDDLVATSMDHITLYTKSSVSAVKLLERAESDDNSTIGSPLKKTSLERSSLLSLSAEEDYFTNWYSNQESVEVLIEMMKPYLQVQAWASKQPEMRYQDKINEYVNSLNPEILDSLLYRLLLEDLVTILIFYLEKNYD